MHLNCNNLFKARDLFLVMDLKEKISDKASFETVIETFERKNKSPKNEANSLKGRINHSVAVELIGKRIGEIDLNRVSFEEYFSSRIWRIHAPWIFSDMLKTGITVLEPAYRANFELRKLYRDFSDFARDYADPYNGKMRC